MGPNGVAAQPVRMFSDTTIERILGRWSNGWVVVGREEGLRCVLLCGRPTTEQRAGGGRAAISEAIARVVMVGDQVVGLCGDEPRAEVTWLEDRSDLPCRVTFRLASRCGGRVD